MSEPQPPPPPESRPEKQPKWWAKKIGPVPVWAAVLAALVIIGVATNSSDDTVSTSDSETGATAADEPALIEEASDEAEEQPEEPAPVEDTDDPPAEPAEPDPEQ